MPEPMFASIRDYEENQLLGGPGSSRLEFSSDYYREEFQAPGNFMLANFLRKNPGAIKHRSIQLSAYTALGFFRKPNVQIRPSDDERHYLRIADCAIENYVASGRSIEFSVDSLPFSDNSDITAVEQREVARLALQHFRVYEAVVETGEVPYL